MKLLNVNNYNRTNFGMEFKLSGKTLNSISRSTGLSKDELLNLSLDDVSKLMKQRGTLKETNKFKQWLADKYKAFGEKMGLLK